MGDYNLPSRDFNYDFKDISILNSTSVDDFVSTLSMLNFYQHNIIKNISCNMLDLNFPDLNYIDVGATIEPLVRLEVDHPALDFSFLSCLPRTQSRDAADQSFNFRNCVYQSVIVNLLQVDWNAVLSEPDISKNVTEFQSISLKVIETFTPKRKSHKRTWYSKLLINSIIVKKRLYGIYKKIKNCFALCFFF